MGWWVTLLLKGKTQGLDGKLMHECVSTGLHCDGKVLRLLKAIALFIPTPGADLPQGRSGWYCPISCHLTELVTHLESPLPPQATSYVHLAL